jgi:hypothetical protein
MQVKPNYHCVQLSSCCCLKLQRSISGVWAASWRTKVKVKHFDRASEAPVWQLVEQHCLSLTRPPAATKTAAEDKSQNQAT